MKYILILLTGLSLTRSIAQSNKVIGGTPVVAPDGNGIISALQSGDVTINGATASTLNILNSNMRLQGVRLEGQTPSPWAPSGLALWRDVPVINSSNQFAGGVTDMSSVYLGNGFRGYSNYWGVAYTYSATPITPAGDAYVCGYSAIPIYDNVGGGALPFMYGHYSAMNAADSSQVTEAYDYYANELNAVRVVSGGPKFQNHYQYYGRAITKAKNNWGVFIAGNQANYFNGTVGIGTLNVANGLSNTHPSAKLEVRSSNQGFLPPRMTATDASAIVAPAEGLMVYVTGTNGTFTTKGWYGYDGLNWVKLN